MEDSEDDALPTRASRERKKPEKFVAGGPKPATEREASDPKTRIKSDKLKRSDSSVSDVGSLLERRVSVSCFFTSKDLQAWGI